MAFRAKSYVMDTKQDVMDTKQDASDVSNLRKSGENIQSSAAISSSEKETNSSSVSTKTKNNVVESMWCYNTALQRDKKGRPQFLRKPRSTYLHTYLCSHQPAKMASKKMNVVRSPLNVKFYAI